MSTNLTSEQIHFIDEPSSNIFLKACPGAGKTKVIVNRFIKRATELSQDFNRKSIAALSFTNVAVNEITTRCNNEKVPHLIEYPNYVGTFDGFLIRYIFRQLFFSPLERPLTILESWDSINAQVVGGRAGVIPLSHFDFSGDQIRINRGGAKSLHVFNQNTAYWQKLADGTRRALIQNSIFSASEVRGIIFSSAEKYLSSIFLSLSSRFSEIIVDEVQDCNSQDLLILGRLRECGVNIVMVGDLDQSIYSFRGVDLAKIRNFVSTHKNLRLTNNFRCSQNICNFSASLKPDNSIDKSESEFKDEKIPVFIYTYLGKPKKIISDVFFGIIADLNLSEKSCKVVSYKEQTSLHTLGMNKNEPGNSAFETLGCAINIYNDKSAPPKEKLQALKNVERLLLRLLGQDIDYLPSEIYCKKFNIEYRWLKRCALYVLDTFPTAPTEQSELDTWISSVKTSFSQLPLPATKDIAWIAPGRIFKKQKNWVMKDTGIDVSYASTIHGVKGEEFTSVLLVMDDKKSDTIMENWKNGNVTESERVIYVAITRAKRLLFIAVPNKFSNVMQEIVEKSGVVYEIIN
jgi:hypothetical protein